MSLGIVIKAPEGLVLAAESRSTLSADVKGPPGAPVQKLNVSFDNANKLLSFSNGLNKFGCVTYGVGSIGLRTPQSLMPEFETSLQNEDVQALTVLQFATKMSDFFLKQWNDAKMPTQAGMNMTFCVAGFDHNEPYGKVYQLDIPNSPQAREQSANQNGQYHFGITVGGQNEIVSRLLSGYDPRLINILVQNKIVTADVAQNVLIPALQPLRLEVPIQFMPLQDVINFAVLMIKTTIEAQSLTMGLRGCGGAIDVAVITKNSPLKFIKKKELFA